MALTMSPREFLLRTSKDALSADADNAFNARMAFEQLIEALQFYVDQYDSDPNTWPDYEVESLQKAHDALTRATTRPLTR